MRRPRELWPMAVRRPQLNHGTGWPLLGSGEKEKRNVKMERVKNWYRTGPWLSVVHYLAFRGNILEHWKTSCGLKQSQICGQSQRGNKTGADKFLRCATTLACPVSSCRFWGREKSLAPEPRNQERQFRPQRTPRPVVMLYLT